MKLDLEAFKRNATFLFELFRKLSELLGAGIREIEIDSFIRSQAVAAGYRSALPQVLPGTNHFCCISSNNTAAHGIPGNRELASADLVTVDVALFDGHLYSDAAWTFAIGACSPEDRELLEKAWQVTLRASETALASPRIRAIPDAVAATVNRTGFCIPVGCYGHGIGRKLHQLPRIPFSREDPLYKASLNARLPDDSAFTIEPIVTLASGGASGTLNKVATTVHVEHDGTINVSPGGKAAQFEFMLWRGSRPGEGEILSLPDFRAAYPERPPF